MYLLSDLKNGCIKGIRNEVDFYWRPVKLKEGPCVLHNGDHGALNIAFKMKMKSNYYK